MGTLMYLCVLVSILAVVAGNNSSYLFKYFIICSIKTIFIMCRIWCSTGRSIKLFHEHCFILWRHYKLAARCSQYLFYIQTINLFLKITHQCTQIYKTFPTPSPSPQTKEEQSSAPITQWLHSQSVCTLKYIISWFNTCLQMWCSWLSPILRFQDAKRLFKWAKDRSPSRIAPSAAILTTQLTSPIHPWPFQALLFWYA